MALSLDFLQDIGYNKSIKLLRRAIWDLSIHPLPSAAGSAARKI